MLRQSCEKNLENTGMDTRVGSTGIIAKGDVGSLPVLVTVELELEAESSVDVGEAKLNCTELRLVSEIF